jgi:hypothetical protein
MTRRQAIPDAKGLVHSLTASNLKPYDAMKEFVDNSIDAGADKVCVLVPQYDSKNNPDLFNVIEILDNGVGMTDMELNNAWRLGATRKYNNSEHGKFGMGMTTATYKIANTIKIISTKDGYNFNTLFWSHDIDNWEYDGYESTTDEIDDYKTKSKKFNISALNHGTLISLGIKVEHLESKSLDTLRENVRKIFGQTYSAYLKGERVRSDSLINEQLRKVDIYFNTILIEPFDPFDTEQDEFYDSLVNNDPLVTLPGARLRVILVKDYPLERSEKKITSEYKGFYCNRNGRYIVWADATRFLLRYHHIFLRFELIWEPSADCNIGLTYNKNEVQFTKEQINEMSDRIAPAKAKAMELYYKNNKDVKLGNNQQKLLDASKTAINTIGVCIATGVIDPVEGEIIKETRKTGNGSSAGSKPSDSSESSGKSRTPKNVAINKCKSEVEFEYINLDPDAGFFESRHENGKFIISINKGTRFFKTMYSSLMDEPKLVDVLNLMFYSMADAQYRMRDTESIAYRQGADRMLSKMNATLETLIRNAETDIKDNTTESDMVVNVGVPKTTSGQTNSDLFLID